MILPIPTETQLATTPTQVRFCVHGVISPVLANIYLHYVFDLWAHRWRRKAAKGDMILVRYADDTIIGFQHEQEAKHFLAEMHQRMAEFGLSLHPVKTRLIEFGRYAAARRARRGMGKPETFNFLGFTHIAGKALSGAFLLLRKTRRDRMKATLKALKDALRKRAQDSIVQQGQWLQKVVRGYFAYHAVPTNSRRIATFRTCVMRLWMRALQRRSQRHCITWERINRLADEWLPTARILHPWPEARFAVKHPR